MKCGAAVSVLLFLLLSLVEVHSQTAPYVTFMGETLPDHSYVDLSLVGDSVSGDEVVCNTDLSTCCNGDAGPHRGDWYFPNGGRLPFPRNDPLVEIRQFQRVELSRDRSGSAPSGIYRCSIETRAVNSDNNTDLTTRETVYVGLYDSGGDQANNILHSEIIFVFIINRQHAAIHYVRTLAYGARYNANARRARNALAMKTTLTPHLNKREVHAVGRSFLHKLLIVVNYLIKGALKLK